MVAGLRALGRPECKADPAGTVVPDWGAKAPLRSNPLLQLEFSATRQTLDWGPPLNADQAENYEVGLAYMASVLGVHTV
eukprot:349859-Chlamydomonas_euryale.AAC.4